MDAMAVEPYRPAVIGRDDLTERAPAHVAIIMDGNGRWAARRGLPRIEGHRRGVEAVRQAVRSAAELGIRYLTIYSFSTENWRRPAQEVADLMALLARAYTCMISFSLAASNESISWMV